MKKEMKPLTERLKPFLAYSASFYANGSHRFKFDTTFVTTMAIFNLEHSDKTLRYGDSMSKVKKEAKKEIKKIFGSNYKYKFAYTGTYPGYVYRPTGNTIVFNSMRIPGKDYQMKVKKITEYEEGKYRLTLEAYLTNVASNTKGEIQKYTVLAAKDEQRDIEARIEEIEKILKNAEVVVEDEVDLDRISVGCKVKVYDYEFEEEMELKLVGSTEANSLEGKISNESPVGKALIGAHTGDVVEVEMPMGIMKYKVLEIQRNV